MIRQFVSGQCGRGLVLTPLLTLLLGSAVWAQTTTGTIRGRVLDEVGAPIGAAQVVATHTETGAQRGTISQVNGFYNLVGLHPGTYELRVTTIGYAPQVQSVRVLIGQSLNIDLQMTAQAVVLEGITAVGTRVMETRTSEVATNVTQEQIDNLPQRDRNFLELATLAPGIRTTGDQFSRSIAFGALPSEQINVFIDGASYKSDILQGGVAGQDASRGNPFPQAAVQEFRVLTQNYKAEYQKASSAIITATTRSGTNVWRGGIFGYGVNDSFVARDAIARERGWDRPDYRRFQVGGSAGGPIQRDRLFFFGTYELNHRDQPVTVHTGGDVGRAPPGLNPQQYAGQFSTEFRQHSGFGKLTFTPSTRHTFDVSANVRSESDVRGFGGETSRQAAENVKNDVYTGVASHRFVTGNLMNEAQLTLQRFSWNPVPLDMDTPGRNYFGIIRVGGRDTRQDWSQDRIGLRNDVTFSGVEAAGNHVFKVGANLDVLRYSADKDLFANPVFNFRADENYLRPFEAFFGFGESRVRANNTQLGLYVQDDWSITPRLELNVGVRWDVETNAYNNNYVTPQALRDSLSGPLADRFVITRPRPGQPSEMEQVRVLDQLGGFDAYFTRGRSDRPAFLGAIQPRIGASFDLLGDGRTVLFGGVGVYYDRDIWNYMLDEQFRRQYTRLQIFFNEEGPTEQCPWCVAWEERYFDPDQLRQLAASGRAGAPEVFMIRNDTRPPRSNQFSGGVRQRVGDALASVSYTGTRSYNGFAFVRVTPWGGLGPNYSQAFASTNDVRTWYDAVTFKLERPISRETWWGGTINYTYAHAEQQGEYFFALDDRFASVSEYPRTASGADQRHSVHANAIARMPLDILFSTVVQLGSGYPIWGWDVTEGWGPGERQRLVFRPPTYPVFGMGRAFATRTVDMRLAKDLPLRGAQRVSLQADLFNAFNTANYTAFDVIYNPDNPNFGVPQAAIDGRRLQLGLRYDF
jgi:outer membrane receptor protein involved in Fe transport